MFFIGIFGIDNKFKEIKVLNNFSCKNCNISNGASLVKYYTFFHFFFIPIFKWNEEYYVICNGCNSSFSIPKEKGKAIERGEDIEISYWDLKDNNINNNYLKKRLNIVHIVEKKSNNFFVSVDKKIVLDSYIIKYYILI